MWAQECKETGKNWPCSLSVIPKTLINKSHTCLKSAVWKTLLCEVAMTKKAMNEPFWTNLPQWSWVFMIFCFGFFFFLFVALHFTIFLRFGTFYFYNVHYNVYLDLVISSSYFFTLYQFPFWKKKSFYLYIFSILGCFYSSAYEEYTVKEIT